MLSCIGDCCWQIDSTRNDLELAEERQQHCRKVSVTLPVPTKDTHEMSCHSPSVLIPG